MTTENNLVSIIIPVYNAEQFLTETIESAINQTYRNWEIVIVNDGSTDKSAGIIEDYVTKDVRISAIHQHNQGVSVARNNGMLMAKGDFIALLDADDVWLPSYLEEKIGSLHKNSSIDFVFSDFIIADEKLENSREPTSCNDSSIFNDIISIKGYEVTGPTSNLFFRKKCLLKSIAFHPELSTTADQHFNLQLAFEFKGMRISQPLWIYRDVTNSMSKNLMLHESDILKAYQLYIQAGYFQTKSFRRICFSNMYLMLAKSWWKVGKNKSRGIYFLLRAFFVHPINTIVRI